MSALYPYRIRLWICRTSWTSFSYESWTIQIWTVGRGPCAWAFGATPSLVSRTSNALRLRANLNFKHYPCRIQRIQLCGEVSIICY